jgi:hypothetical protein
MRKEFEDAAVTYDRGKKEAQKHKEAVGRSFEGAKTKMAQEILTANSAEDLMALAKKLREKSEFLKSAEGQVGDEDAGWDKAYEDRKSSLLEADYNEGHETKKSEEKESASLAAKKLEEDNLKDKEKSAKQAEEILNKLKGEGAGSEAKGNYEKIQDDPTYTQLKIVYSEMNGPGSYNPDVKKRFDDLSKEVASKLNNTSDIKETYFYLNNEGKDTIAKKWDKLSRQKVESAASEEEMKKAMKNIRPGGFDEPMKLREIAISKYPSLRGPRGY